MRLAACLLAMLVLDSFVRAADPPGLLADGAAATPWTTYQAEAMATTGIVVGPQVLPGQPSTEASGRCFVHLAHPGDQVAFSATVPATGLVVRYSIADSPGGGGRDSGISVRVNGRRTARLTLTSRLSWSYGPYPFTHDPVAGAPRRCFDEVRTLIPPVRPGDAISLVLDPGDAPCDLDLVDLEAVPEPLAMPRDAESVTAHGAIADDGGDDTGAFRASLAAARRGSRIVWIPAGTFQITGVLDIPDGVTVQGAGMWRTTLIGNPDYAPVANRLTIRGGSGITLADFALTGRLAYRDDREPNDGCSGSFGSDSTLRHLWIEHTKTGVWAVQSRRLTIAGCRFRNTVADGCNLCVGVRESLVVDCTARGTGDDGFALWPAVYTDEVYPAGRNRVYRCTAQVPILGNGFAVYGGRDQRIEDCRAEDIPYGCGILVSTAFPAAPFTGTTQIAGCRIVRAGGCDFRTIEDARDRAQAFRWRGSLLLAARRRDLIGIAVTDLTVDASISDAIAFSASTTASLLDCHMEGVRINGTGLGAPGVPFHAWADARGSVRVGGIAIEGGTDASYRIDTSEFTVHPATDP